jgi:hypothetical protein
MRTQCTSAVQIVAQRDTEQGDKNKPTGQGKNRQNSLPSAGQNFPIVLV